MRPFRRLVLNPGSVCIYRMRSTRSNIYHSDLLPDAISLDLPRHFLSRSLVAAIPAFLTAGTVRPVANASGLSSVFAPGSRPRACAARARSSPLPTCTFRSQNNRAGYRQTTVCTRSSVVCRQAAEPTEAHAHGRHARSEWNLAAIPGAENISVMPSTRSTIKRIGYHRD